MRNNRRIKMDQKGFTLVEIIAVLVILGILAAVAVPKFFDMQASAEKKALLTAYSDMNSRMNSQFSKSMLEHDGKADKTEFADFADLGLNSDPLSEIYKDYAGTWTYGASTITYAPANGSVASYAFTIDSTSAGPANPGTIVVTPPLK